MLKILEFLTIYLIIFGIIKVYRSYTKNKVTKLAAHHKVYDVMHRTEELLCLEHLDTLRKISEKIIRSYQTYFPVLNGEKLIGIVNREEIISRIVLEPDQYVASLAWKGVTRVDPTTSLENALQSLNKSNPKVLAVVSEDKFIGLLIEDKVEELILLQNLKTLNEDSI